MQISTIVKRFVFVCLFLCVSCFEVLAQDVLDGQQLKQGSETSFAAKQNFSWIDTYGKSPTEFSIDEWKGIIDATWGNGLDTSAKLTLFDTWWDELDANFGAFHGLEDVDLDTLRAIYRPQVEAGVSKGRFSGIMNHMTYRLKELHTYLFDVGVRNTPMNKGIPMMNFGQFGTNQRFGALLSPLPDSTLLVYEVLPNHPIGLEPGDVILGYDGVLWKDIYPQLLEAELPLFLNPVNASTDEGNYYYAMQSAGLNWHLFDTLDVVKYSSGDTLHYDTNLLAGQSGFIWGKEQIPPPGVPWPNRTIGKRVGWGVIDGSKVGMVTVTSWSFDAQFDIRNLFEEAVIDMMFNLDVDGIIFDFRFNTGGGALAREGLQRLFNNTVPTVGFDRRVSGSADRFAMEPDPSRQEVNLVVRGQPGTFFDKPIAILIGPGAISAGELEARRMSFHPKTRIFGLPAAGGNTGSDFISIGNSNWFVSRANSAQYLASNHEYITRTALQPDERIWFTKEDAAKREDTVIKAAMNWINAEFTSNEQAEGRDGLALSQYPNPFSDKAVLAVTAGSSSTVSLRLFDVLGREVITLLDHSQIQGSRQVIWDGVDATGKQVAPGLYFWQLTDGRQVLSGSMTVIR